MRFLYESMLEIAQKSPFKFSIKRETIDNHHFINFMYNHGVENKDFNNSTKLEMRGILFEVKPNDEFIRIASRPLEKFFNNTEHLQEDNTINSVVNKMYDIDIKAGEDIYNLPIKHIYEKLDGCIVSSFMCGDDLLLKSNASIKSGESNKANEMLSQSTELKSKVKRLAKDGWTTIFEMIWLHGTNNVPIVLNKPEGLYALAVRNNITGEYMPYREVLELFGNHVVKTVNNSVQDILNGQKTEEGIEGYVVETECGLRYKVKNAWYFRQRYSEYGKINKKLVATSFLNNNLDDILIELNDNQKVLFKQWEKEIKNNFNSIVSAASKTYEANAHKDRKDFFRDSLKTNKGGKNGAENYLVRMFYKTDSDYQESLNDFRKYLLKGKNVFFIMGDSE